MNASTFTVGGVLQVKNVRRSLVACLLYASVSSGDIAPTTYEGYTLSAKQNSDIRMASEEVNIYVGQRCRVNAKFEMQNETDKSMDLFVGFPVQNEGSKKQAIYDFQVKLDGKDPPGEIQRVRQGDQYGVGLTWFGWDQTFPPGRTLVEVEYHIEPSYSYRQSWQNVYYVLRTGKYWKGTIGLALITVHFDRPLAREQVREATSPKGFQVVENRVHWQFTDLEPTREDDICVEYMPFRIYDKLERLRRKVESDPDNEAFIVDLARHYFALGHYNGVVGGLPGELTPDRFNLLRTRITDPNDRKDFEAAYHETSKRAFTPIADPGTGLVTRGRVDDVPVYALRGSHERIVEILNSIDYAPYGLSEHVVAARDMLDRLLKENPHNADAWMVYLSHYYRFKFGGSAPRHLLDEARVPLNQKEIVQRAYSYCPFHEGIKLWHESVTSENRNADRAFPSRSPLWEYCEKMGVYNVQWGQ